MYIKKILEYSYSYAEYVVSDGVNDLICMCVSVPLPNNNVPKTGMKVEQIYAFSCNDIIKVKKTEDKRELINKGDKHFQYTIRGRILDTHKAIIQVLGFTISLEYDYPKGFNSDFMHNDYVEFDVDRLDCLLSN